MPPSVALADSPTSARILPQGSGFSQIFVRAEYADPEYEGEFAGSEASIKLDGDRFMVSDLHGIERTDAEDPYSPFPCTTLDSTLLSCPGESTVESISFSGGPGDDTLDVFANQAIGGYDMGGGDDVVRAGPERSFAAGGPGNDTLALGPGLDGPAITVSGDQGDDTVLGEDGPDYVAGSEGNDTVDGGSGDDHVWGGLGPNEWDNDGSGNNHESPIADDENDVLRGGDGDDILYPGAGADLVDAGAGNDQIAPDPGEDGAVDQITCGPDEDSVGITAGDVVASDCEAIYERVFCPDEDDGVGCQGTITVRTPAAPGAQRDSSASKRARPTVLAKEHFRFRRKADIELDFIGRRVRRALGQRASIRTVRRIAFVREPDDKLPFRMDRP